MKTINFVFILILFIKNGLFSQKIHPDAGSTAASFLKIPIGSRTSSLGGGFSSFKGDILGVFYNPASTSVIDRRIFVLMHNIHISDIKHYGIVYGFNPSFIKSREDYFSVYLNYLTYGNFEKRSGLYESNPFSPSPVEGNFTAEDLMIGLNYSFIYKSFSLGINSKIINQRIENESASAIAFDVGCIKTLNYRGKDLNFGFAIQNIGTKIKFISESYSLPLSFKLGISSDFNDLTLSFDMLKYIDNYPYFIFGFEKRFSKMYIDTSYKYRLYGNEGGFISGVAFGGGVEYQNFRLGSGINFYKNLGASYKIDLIFKF